MIYVVINYNYYLLLTVVQKKTKKKHFEEIERRKITSPI